MVRNKILWRRGIKIDADAMSQLYYTFDLDKWLPEGVALSHHEVVASENINVVDSHIDQNGRESLVWLNNLALNTEAWVRFEVEAQMGAHALKDNWTVYFRVVDH